jgi:hypothetical protein
MRRLYILVVFVMLALTCGTRHCSPPANADLLDCPYPGVGDFTEVRVAWISGRGFTCDFPIEINGSFRHCILIDGGVGGAFQLNGTGSTFGFGGTRWSCHWYCPSTGPGDLQPAEQPNPPGRWNKRITPEPCKPVGSAQPLPAGPAPATSTPTPQAPQDTNPTPPNPESLEPSGN